MVVTRKTPLVPPPPTSRTSSSQATPRAAKSRAQVAPTVLPAGDDSRAESKYEPGSLNSGEGKTNDVGSLPHKHKLKSKSKKQLKKNTKSRIAFGELLVYLLLASLTIYTIRVCPADINHDSSVCYGLFKYRQLVLEPYVLPVFHRALAHPSIAPHVQRVKPHFDTAVRISRPIVRRARVTWKSRVVPQWNKRVVPQWNKHVVPQWRKYAVPQLLRINQIVDPYRSRVIREYTRYSNRISPHLRIAKTNLRRWKRQAQPYVVLAATKTYNGYQAAKPYAIPVWNRTRAGIKQMLLFAKAQRVLFVDPHVARIWEKVKELSSGKPKGSSTSREEPAVPQAAASLTEGETITAEEEAVLPPTSSSSFISSAAKITSSVAVGSPTSASAAPTTAAESSTAAATESSTSVTASPLIAPITESEELASVLESTSPTISPSSVGSSPLEEGVLSSIGITGPSLITEEPVPTPLEVADESDIDLDAFAREIGLDDQDIAEPDETTVTPPEETESDEEKAERKRLKDIETAEIRADITGRHSKWEADLQRLIKAKEKSLRKVLVAIRKPAAVELKQHKEIRATINRVAAESEKYVKGAEAYLKTLKTESKKDAAKVASWHKLIDKVDAKFREKLKEMDNVVNSWYMDVLNREAYEVQLAITEVRDLAEQGQTDIGMDYSWLPDVTYEDWQRYHDLIRVSDKFAELATSIQKGKHPSSPVNPIVTVLEEMESEVEDIVDNFETRLQQLKHEGEHPLTGQVKHAKATTSMPKPAFSVLPIPEDDVDREGATGDIPPVVVGRSKEEVVDAFGRAGEEGVRVTPSRSTETESEDIAVSLAQEMSGKEDQATAGEHVEL